MQRYARQQLAREQGTQEAALIDNYVTWAEDEQTALAKWDTANPKFEAIKRAHGCALKSASVLRQAQNVGRTIKAREKRAT